MIKKLSLVCFSLVFIANLHAQDEYELSLKYGLTSLEHEDGMTFENNTFALDGVYDMGAIIKPRIDFAYVLVHDEKRWGGVSSLVQFAVGGQYAKSWEQIPFSHETYLFAGLGYEVVVDGYDKFDSLPFMQAGLGVKYGVTDEINLLGEFKAMQAFDGNSQSGDEDNEFAIFIGVNMPFGVPVNQRAQGEKKPTSLSSMPVEMIQEAENTHEMMPDTRTVEARAMTQSKDRNVTILLDSDGDGVTDDIDLCEKTQLGMHVDKVGCAPLESRTSKKECEASDINSSQTTQTNRPKVQNLGIDFAEGMAIINAESLEKLKVFAAYVKSLPLDTVVTIHAYTDNRGKAEANKKLSSKRAHAVRNVLIGAGLKKSSVRAYGLGIINPIADNDTAEGRAKNRRIEAVITYGRR